MAVIRDTTERKRAERALADFNRKLNLLSGINRHDILNQLTVLISCLELQREMTSDPGPLKNLAKIERSASIIKEQLEFSRDYEEMGTKTSCWQRLAFIFEALPQIKSISSASMSPQVRRIEVLADPMLGRVLYNLVDNSLRHGGKVGSVSLDCHQEGEDLVIVYGDDGSGIPLEEKELIFLRGQGKGSGLGLFLSKEILAITDIGISEHGRPGKGARYEIRVPSGKYRFV
jgi:signal transduction histidine kinase